MRDIHAYEAIGMRRFHQLQPGDKFKAMIHDIKPGEVTINLGGGALYTARSMILPEARIGEASVFSVRENDFDGRIVLGMDDDLDYLADTLLPLEISETYGTSKQASFVKLKTCGFVMDQKKHERLTAQITF